MQNRSNAVSLVFEGHDRNGSSFRDSGYNGDWPLQALGGH